MNIYVTGAKGLLGSDLCAVLEKSHNIIKNSVDIRDFKALNREISKSNAELIIHLGAYTDVDKAEFEPQKAYEINAKACENIAKIADKMNAKIIYVSTDYVFDGTKTAPYKPNDKTNPVNIYGKTKLEGEFAIKKYAKKYHIVRTCALYGQYGKNFVDTVINLKNEKEICVIDDEIVCPTWSGELSDNLLKVLDFPYGIYHICSDGYVSRYELAKKIYEILNIKTKVINSAHYKTIAKRPKYCVLDSSIKLQPWEKSLRTYLSLQKTKQP